jgi:hypothetical protein
LSPVTPLTADAGGGKFWICPSCPRGARSGRTDIYE